jgi:uncharacterized protein (TIGR02145 family)
MTTNLAAWAYDSNISTATLPSATSAASDYVEPKWCYPKPAGTVTEGESAPPDWNSRQGLLYNWPAATGKQNMSTAQQGQVAGAEPGSNEVEKMTSGAGYQGICPDGWHLPSDREWNQLEKEIYEHPENYSTYSGLELPFTSTYNPGVGAGSDGTAQSGWRSEWESGTIANSAPNTISGYNWRGVTPNSGTTPGHGHAMVDICGVNSINPNGRSKNLAGNGFSVLLVGYALGGGIEEAYYGRRAYIWSSSSGDAGRGWYRILFSNAAVFRAYSSRNYLWSVRCKKD